MAIDTSAVLAILLGEEDAPRFARAVEDAETCSLSAAKWLAAAVIDYCGDAVASREFDTFLGRAGADCAPRVP